MIKLDWNTYLWQLKLTEAYIHSAYKLDHVKTRTHLHVRKPNLVQYYKLLPDVYDWLSQQLGEFSLKQFLPQHDLQMLK